MEIKAPSEEFLKKVLCYPTFDASTFAARLNELKELGVYEVLSSGPSGISRWKTLGKGHAGIVVTAKHLRANVALKIMRTDAERTSMEQEGSMLAYANTLGVGPRLLKCSKDFLVSELIVGEPLMSWVQGRIHSNQASRCARSLMFQGFRMDTAGLDHGELSRPDKHVLLQAQGGPVIIDFESASLTRRPNNLLSLVQFLFIRRKSLRDTFADRSVPGNTADFLTVLRAYKAHKSLENYRSILRFLGLGQ